MRVMLVYPNDRMDGLIPVGTSVLSSHLKAAGHDVKLYDTTFVDTGKKEGDFYRENLGQVIPVDLSQHGVSRQKMSLNQLQNNFRSAVVDYRPGLIGFSTLEITYDQGLELAKAIQDLPIPKIFGGIYPTFAPRIVLREPSIDMICEGEGEEMLPQLATALERSEDITKILNLTAKVRGKIYRSGEEVTLESLPTGDNIYGEHTGLRRPQTHMGQVLLAPDYSIYEDSRFWKKMGGQAVRTVAMELSRGCPYTCTFCCVPMQQEQHRASREQFASTKGLSLFQAKKEDPYHREKPIDKFMAEVESAIENYDINFVYFTDESFLSMNKARFEEFVNKYGRIKLPFFIETRVETVRPGYAEALESVGCAGVAMGVESGSFEVRKALLKRLMPDDVIVRGFREFEKTSIRISANNIIGFPRESREDIMRTIEINCQINPDSIVVNSFRPYSGTELRKICIEMGLIPAEERAEDNRVYGAFYNGVLSAEELEGLRRAFNLYVKFPKERWDEVRLAETDDLVFNHLKQEFQADGMLHRQSRGVSRISAEEIFIND
ncbi:MAG TPA: radical SAM protein [Candidatus Nanoarchaeia archaeon]|nr:radical SAM protein [Candidatus Nanoarchaeia archaeon]